MRRLLSFLIGFVMLPVIAKFLRSLVETGFGKARMKWIWRRRTGDTHRPRQMIEKTGNEIVYKETSSTNTIIHTGFFLKWCMCGDFISESFKSEYTDDIKSVISGEMSGTEFLNKNCAKEFTNKDLSKVGSLFAEDYFNEESAFTKLYNTYFNDLAFVFNFRNRKGKLIHTEFHRIQDSANNYTLISSKISERFQEWAEFKKI